MPDILMLLVQLTQKMMEDKLMFISEVQVRGLSHVPLNGE